MTNDNLELLEILKMLSPGTMIRTAVDDLVRAHLGALIVFHSEKLEPLLEGGFRLNTKLTHQKLVELSKMDGAIIITADRKKILYANTMLVPDKNIPTNETGTRHKAGERTAKQAETVAVAVSERKNKVSIYYKDMKYILRSSSELLNRATEMLQILEKQREIYDSLLSNMNILEITNLVTVRDVCSLIQRIETIKKIASTIERYILELGKEGIIIKMRFKELLLNIEDTENLLIEDYVKIKSHKVKQILSDLSFDSLLDTPLIANLLFSRTLEEKITPKGRRFLKNTSLNLEHTDDLISRFGNLANILNSSEEKLIEVLKTHDDFKRFSKETEKLKEQILAGKKF